MKTRIILYTSMFILLFIASFLYVHVQNSVVDGLISINEGLPDISGSDCESEVLYKKLGLIDIQSVDSTIRVELLNSSTNNMTGEDLYGCLEKAYILPEFAEKLKKAQAYLKELHPQYSLKILDATRPLSVQVKMWEKVKGTKSQEFIADPLHGSMHNYGAAVDITITNSSNELDMGSENVRTVELLKSTDGKLIYRTIRAITDKQKQNRELLSRVMIKAGCHPIKNEWWHFDCFTKAFTRSNFKIIE